MAVDDTLHGRQANPTTFKLLVGVQPLEGDEQSVIQVRWKACSIVRD
jgi:hypothetical protein